MTGELGTLQWSWSSLARVCEPMRLPSHRLGRALAHLSIPMLVDSRLLEKTSERNRGLEWFHWAAPEVPQASPNSVTGVPSKSSGALVVPLGCPSGTKVSPNSVTGSKNLFGGLSGTPGVLERDGRMIPQTSVSMNLSLSGGNLYLSRRSLKSRYYRGKVCQKRSKNKTFPQSRTKLVWAPGNVRRHPECHQSLVKVFEITG